MAIFGQNASFCNGTWSETQDVDTKLMCDNSNMQFNLWLGTSEKLAFSYTLVKLDVVIIV